MKSEFVKQFPNINQMFAAVCVLTAVLFFAPSVGSAQQATEADCWSKKVWVDDGQEICVVYQAAVFKNALVVKFQHQKSWHTFAMDNNVRVKKALAGKKSLGSEEPTSISVTGLENADHWLQSKPSNFSKPELRWFTWGFEKEGFFALRLPKSVDKKDLSKIAIKVEGQTCNGGTCLPVSVSISLNQDNFAKKDFDLTKLERPLVEETTKKESGDWKASSEAFAIKKTEELWQDLAYYTEDKGISITKILPDLKAVGFGSTDPKIRFSSYIAKESAKLIGLLDPDRDSWISKEEMIEGIKKQIFQRMDHRILQDADLDGKVSAKEYSVSLRPGKREVDKDGLTKRSRSFFERSDVNKNGYIDLATEVFPDSSKEVGSQMSRLVVILALSKKVQSTLQNGEISKEQFFKLMRPVAAENKIKIWKGLQDLGRFRRRGRGKKEEKVYDTTIKCKSIAYRISMVEDSVLKLIEENL